MEQENKKRPKIYDVVIICLVAVALITAYNFIDINKITPTEEIVEIPTEEPIENLKFGFSEDDYHIQEHTLFPNQFLSDILMKYDVSLSKVFQLEEKAKDIYSVRNIRAGKKYAIIQKDSCSAAECLVYQPDPFKYVVYDLRDTLDVKIIERDVTTTVESTAGIVKSSLWMSMKEQGLSPVLIEKMEDALAWSIDFYHIQDGDRYKLIFERRYIDGEPVGIGQLKGAYYKNADNQYYAVYYENEEYSGFYDLEGRPTKKGFLKSPVKASRISSSFNMNRLHPILKRRKPHLGTDYAAPYGTPILAVGNGVVTKAAYTKGNGKYVKIKHDKTFSTQYLHMQRFAPGIKPGVHVKQGDVIGHVGSTGLATGPHVCFRFWKNGRQVNHLKENFPPPEPMPQDQLPEFFESRDRIIEQLDDVKFEDETQISSNTPEKTVVKFRS
ncbi:peptidoglycan DD-metalloendopeptidase family protein [Portibacter lacus]|uniref:Peptidase M23 n=1 Tax=Portibacter lacus TaxID=1099794 RepID=A0AA37SPI3_9BACT|nr:peptidoglycan DD-metalloendopeptidase family protein [Portibacter lacus]GLR17449.1 peptidase M23 [Portibacter lacus]